MLPYEKIAEICHENNRAYCHAFGDYSSPAWKYLSPEMQSSTIKGVEFHIANPDASPKASHEKWVEDKLSKGWKIGPAKNMEKKEHPNLVSYAQLSQVERGKDTIFAALVNILKTI